MEVNEWHRCAKAGEAKEEDVKSTERHNRQEGVWMMRQRVWKMTLSLVTGHRQEVKREECVCESSAVGWLTYAHIFIVQFSRGIAVVARLA